MFKPPAPETHPQIPPIQSIQHVFWSKIPPEDAPIYTSPSRDSSPSERPSTILPSFLRQRASLYGCVKIYQNNNIKCYLEIPLAAALQRSFQQPKLP